MPLCRQFDVQRIKTKIKTSFSFAGDIKYQFHLKSLLLFLVCLLVKPSFAQYEATLFAGYTTREARNKMHERIIKNTITRNLSTPLNAETEEIWQDAFTAIEVFNFSTPVTTKKVEEAFDSLSLRSISFQRALLEIAYANYPVQFTREVWNLLEQTADPRIFAMSAEYLLQMASDSTIKRDVLSLLLQKFPQETFANTTLFVLSKRLQPATETTFEAREKIYRDLLKKDFLPGKIVMYSFQRKDRNFPGLALMRNATGEFIKNDSGEIYSVAQLARSITNLPFYLRNGNTPQGIYRMFGFGVSLSNFIGPTPNVQMGMPGELTKRKFFDDITLLPDTSWNIEDYRKMLPVSSKDYDALFGSYYAGIIGRNEIIAHGTTLDPELYAGKSYFPLTPTMGCLTSGETWDGRRLTSDQQKLVNGLLKAGGARGYVVVIEIDDKKQAVSLADILHLLP